MYPEESQHRLPDDREACDPDQGAVPESYRGLSLRIGVRGRGLDDLSAT